MNFEVVTEFEKKIAEFFGAPFAVAVDSCTHGIELCLRAANAGYINCPLRTYLSVPMLADKLDIGLLWKNENWQDFYEVFATPKASIYDAAVFWKKDGFRNNYQNGRSQFMCVSFQYQKHLNLGRGGVILCDHEADAILLKKMSYDGRLPGIPWREQNIDTMGYHYYMTPETAQLGLDKLQKAIDTEPRKWTVNDWPDLTKMDVFKN